MNSTRTDPAKNESTGNGLSSGPLERLCERILAWRATLLLLAVVLVAVAVVPAGRLRFDQRIESLYAEDDPHLAAFRASRSLFGGDEFIIVAYDEPSLLATRTTDAGDTETMSRLQPEAEQRLTTFAENLGSVPGVQARSTQHLGRALAFPYGRRRVLDQVEGVLVGEDRRTVAIVLRLEPAEGPEASMNRATTFAAIRKLAAAHVPPAEVVGEPVQVHDMFRYVEDDGRTLFWWSLGLLAAVILLLFGRLRWVLLPLAVVVAAITWTEALLAISGMRLSMVSSMLNSLVTIIGIATVTHVTVHYRELRRECERVAALERTLRELAPPVFWTGATTAVGFAALLSSQITPVQSFGIMMALATMLVLVASLMLLPGGILFGSTTVDPGQAPGEGQLVKGLESLARGIRRRSGQVLAGTLAIVILAGAGLTRLEVETNFSENFREESPIRQGLKFVESKLGGAGNWEVNFPVPSKLGREDIDRVAKLADRLRKEVSARLLTEDSRPRLTKVVALSDGLAMVPRIPLILNTLTKQLKVLDRFQSEYVSTLYNPRAGRMRIVLRALEQEQAGQKRELIERTEEIARETFPATGSGERPVEATGLYVLLTFLIESLLRDQVVSFFLAAVGIAVMLGLAFRSLRLGMVAVLPNLFPIVLVIGTMGWIGLPVNIATAMIASVSLGLTVDSSIHYISGFRRARARGLDVAEALQQTHSSVGRAVVMANLALIVGFSVLTLSHFIPLVYFGILVSVAMLGGLAGNLVLLPVLLARVERRPEPVADDPGQQA
ncbi:MAG: MMPL family transporter [Planctomycetaceae bacterium]|jgi:hypothetical protein|nr:MMPL family transporter [Planctomycetaceae bacterium]